MATTIQHIELPKKPRALDTSTSVQEISQELIDEGNFSGADDGDPWVVESGWTISSNKAHYAPNTGREIYQTVTTVAGRTYSISYEVSNWVAEKVGVYTTQSSNATTALYEGDEDGSYSRTFIATGSTAVIRFRSSNTLANLSIDNASVKEIESFSNNNHGKIYSGRALEFDGVSDNLQIVGAPGGSSEIDGVNSFDEGNAYTWSTWIYLNSLNDARNWFLGSGSTNPQMRVRATGFLEFREDGSDRAYYTLSDKKLELKTWYRLVVTADASNTMKCYINGVLNKTISAGDASLTSGSGSGEFGVGSNNLGTQMQMVCLGNSYLNSDGTNYPLDGMLSDFQIWDATWSAADAAYDYANPESLALNASGTALTESNLKVWYPMQDGHRGQQSYILDGANTGIVSALIDYDFSTDTTSEFAAAYTSSENDRGAIRYVADGFLRVTYTGTYSAAVLNKGSILTSGKNYKITFRAKGTHDAIFASVGNNGEVGNAVSNPVLTTDWQNYEFYITAAQTILRLYQSGTPDADQTLDIDNILVQPINDKHHATTVFYGDEMITEVAKNSTTFSSHNWADLNITDTTVAVSGGKLVVVTDDGSSQEEGISLAASLIDGEGGNHPVTIGRTYRVSADLQNTAGVTTPSLQFAFGGASSPTFTITASEVTYTKDIVATADGNPGSLYIKHMGSVETGTTTFTVDNISVKEIGVASGWTDADQQLDIAQPALQSYNELGWSGRTGNRVEVASLAANLGTNNFAISYVINRADFTGDRRYFGFNSGVSDVGRIIHRISSTGMLEIYVQDSDSTAVVYASQSADGAISVGETYHIVEFFDRTANLITTYINGVASGVTVSLQDSADPPVILDGTIHCNGDLEITYWGETFVGIITEIALWKNTDFSATEVLELYNDGKPLDALTHTKADTLEGYWRNNGLSTWVNLANPGTKDSTTNTLTETLLIPQGVDGSRDTQGFIMNKARNTSSLNLPLSPESGYNSSYIDIPSFDFHATTMSISFWMKARSLVAGATILDKYVTSGNKRALRLLVKSSEELQLLLSSTGSDYEAEQTTDANLTIDTWYHIVITYSSGTWLVYKDTDAVSLDAAAFITTTSIEQNTTALLVGGSHTDKNQFEGEIDNLLVYDAVLSETEVQKNYKATKGSHKN